MWEKKKTQIYSIEIGAEYSLVVLHDGKNSLLQVVRKFNTFIFDDVFLRIVSNVQDLRANNFNTAVSK